MIKSEFLMIKSKIPFPITSHIVQLQKLFPYDTKFRKKDLPSWLIANQISNLHSGDIQ